MIRARDLPPARRFCERLRAAFLLRQGKNAKMASFGLAQLKRHARHKSWLKDAQKRVRGGPSASEKGRSHRRLHLVTFESFCYTLLHTDSAARCNEKGRTASHAPCPRLGARRPDQVLRAHGPALLGAGSAGGPGALCGVRGEGGARRMLVWRRP